MLLLLIVWHDAASKDAINGWVLADLCLVPLMVSHTIRRANVHIRSCLTSHAIEHHLSLLISSSLVVKTLSHSIDFIHSSVSNHVVLVLVCELGDASDTWWVLSSVTIFHLSNVLLTLLFLVHSSNVSDILLNNSLLETVSSFSHLISAKRSGFLVRHLLFVLTNAPVESCVGLDGVTCADTSSLNANIRIYVIGCSVNWSSLT